MDPAPGRGRGLPARAAASSDRARVRAPRTTSVGTPGRSQAPRPACRTGTAPASAGRAAAPATGGARPNREARRPALAHGRAPDRPPRDPRRCETKLLKLSDRRLRERLVGKLRQRRTPPQPQRLRAAAPPPPLRYQPPARRDRVRPSPRTAPGRPHPARPEARIRVPGQEHPPVRSGTQSASSTRTRRSPGRRRLRGSTRAIGAQGLAEPRDIRPHGAQRRLRRRLAPQIID